MACQMSLQPSLHTGNGKWLFLYLNSSWKCDLDSEEERKIIVANEVQERKEPEAVPQTL